MEQKKDAKGTNRLCFKSTGQMVSIAVARKRV